MWTDDLVWVDAGHGMRYTIHFEDGAPITLYEKHHCPLLGDNAGAIPLDVPQNSHVPADGKWQIESVDPLTLSPSLLCPCGHHGFIRNGLWEPC